MRFLHVVSHIDREASGPGYSVPALCDALAAGGHEVVLATLKRDAVSRARKFRHDSYAPSFGGHKLGGSRAMASALKDSAANADIVHSHGLWMMPNIYAAEAATAASRPFVVSPRGTLSTVALARSRWRKRLLWSFAQRRAVHAATAFHATSEQEYFDIRRMGFNAPVAVIPNGIDVPPEEAPISRSAKRRLLYLGRIHPIKGLENLLRAWTEVAERFPDWELRLVGPGDQQYEHDLEQLREQLAAPRVTFTGPRFGAEKAAEYRASELYVLPSFSENFGMSVAEALAHGLPVIATTGTPWSELEPRGCGWRVDPNSVALADILSRALAMDAATLAASGQRGRQWMHTSFAWPQIANQMEAVYEWLLCGGTPPDTVRLD